MKITAIFLLCIFAWAQSFTFLSYFNKEWKNFKVTYGKQYHSVQEETKRFRFFIENSDKIIKHNRLYELGKTTFTMKMNQFGDMNTEEIVASMNGLRTQSLSDFKTPEEGAPTFLPPANIGTLPAAVDWRLVGGVTEVKNQSACGSCWSFSATGALEGQLFRKSGKTVSLSEQNLIDCSWDFGNYGCSGGLMTNSYNYVRENKGIDTEAYYPYEADESKCKYNAKFSPTTDHGYINIEIGNEKALQAAVATVGPISVGIDASDPSFHFYSGGVYNVPSCSSLQLDHAVLVVGYNTTVAQPQGVPQEYWIVKNSWGSKWGLQGYIYMTRNANNQCGIATLASYPLV